MLRPLWLSLLLVACGSSSAPPSSPRKADPTAPVAVPGDCVDPIADAASRQAEELAVLGETPSEVSGTPDVDGDGTADRMFSAGAGVTTSTVVYVMRGDCGHFVGDVGQPPTSAGDAEHHHGLVDLRVADSSTCEGARCGCEPGELWYRFDGTAYRLDEAASRPSTENACPGE